MPRFTQYEMRRLEEQSNENMLIFYEEEMIMIANGAKASNFIAKPLISRLVKRGFLVRGKEKGKRKIKLSRKGRERYGLPP